MICLTLFWNFLMIGSLSFGGGYGMISLVREVVLGHGWLTESEFLSFIAVSESTTRVILPYDTDRYLVGTSTGAIYIYDQKNFIPWNLSLSRQLRGQELNCAIYSAKRNTYYLGTQLSGIYEVDTHGNILNHFSTANILQNNTVLSLYEDNQNNIWVALDRGLAYIRYTYGLSYYRSTDGGFGGIYDATICGTVVT